MEKPELDFAMIDGKDNDLVMYEPPCTEHNFRVFQMVKKEYLERLNALQEELKEKYNCRFQEEEETDGRFDDDFEASEKVVANVWGGKNCDMKYDNLYYT